MTHQPYTVTLAEWEGPLDLLLHVIRSHELDILDIPIAFVTEQYLGYLDLMQSLNLDVAAEYLEMAATLAYIKSRMLLPKPEPEEEEPEEEADPREELIRRLLEYQRYKDAALQLGSRPILGKDTFGGAAQPSGDLGEEPLIEIGVYELVDAFRKILERSQLDLSHEVTAERITVSERIGEIVGLLRPNERVPIEYLVGGERTKLRLVVTLLALLEMCRLKMIHLTQLRQDGPIYASIRGSSPSGSGPRLRLIEGGAERSPHPLPPSRTLHLLGRCRRLPSYRRRPKGPERWRAKTKVRRRNTARGRSSKPHRGRR